MQGFRLLFVVGAVTMSAAVLAAVPAAPGMVTGFPPKVQPADLVLRNANIATLDVLLPDVEALAVRNGKIEAVGTSKAIERYIGKQTKVLDLNGAFVTPGFIEGHGHLLETGESLMQLDVGKAANWDAVVALVKTAVAKAKPGQWVVAQGWQQAKWNRAPQPNIEGLPLPASLDAVSPNNPVILIHASRHAIYANAAALKAAGIDAKTANPTGGEIVRDAKGHAIGMLRDEAAKPVWAAHAKYVASLPAEERNGRRERALQLAVQDAVSKGITSFNDMGENFRTIDWLKQQAEKGLPLRLNVNITGESVDSLDENLAKYKIIGAANNRFSVRGIGEIPIDGALGTHTAWFMAPYADAPSGHGIPVADPDTVWRTAKIAARDGFQLSLHAIGDLGNRSALNVAQMLFWEDPRAQTLRWRIEHAQHLAPRDQSRFHELGVIASMQSIHACSDAPMVVKRLGEQRAESGAYVWQDLIKSGALVTEGTDTPVEDVNPLPNFYCALTRAYDHGKKTFYPDQAKTAIQELRGYTWNNAYAMFQEDQLGSISVGKLADFTIFSGDLLTMPPFDVLNTRVLYTIVGGKIVYQRPGADKWQPGQTFETMPEFNHAQ